MDQQNLIKQEMDSNAEYYDDFIDMIKEDVPVTVAPYICPDRNANSKLSLQ